MNKKTQILYVDDELINLQLFKIIFSDKYEVSIADSGKKGLELLDDNAAIKVVISDMKMPNMNGLEFIHRAKNKYPAVKFYILTGFEISDEIQTAINTQLISKYFMKPLNKIEIDKAITESNY